MNDKREDWSYYLEQVTYSINIRPRETTDYSDFELMHGNAFHLKLKSILSLS